MKIPAFLYVIGCFWLRFDQYVNGDSSTTEFHLSGAGTTGESLQSLKKRNGSSQLNSGVAIGNMAANETDLDLPAQNTTDPLTQNVTLEANEQDPHDITAEDSPTAGPSMKEPGMPSSGSPSNSVVWVLLGLMLGLVIVSVLVTQYSRQKRKRRLLHLNEPSGRICLEPAVQFELLRRTSGASQDGAP